MKAIAIIPARGGSKRIPGKNIREFCKRPIIAYSIETAIKSNLFEDVMVSTDDEQIAGIAKRFGAQVPFLRSKENSNDFAGITDVCIEVVGQYRKMGKSYDVVCCLLPTSPFVSVDRLIAAKKMLDSGSYDSVFPVAEYSYPIQRSLKIETGFIKMLWPGNFHKRSQDLEKTYHDAGQFYFIKTETLMSERKMFVARSGGIVLHDPEVQDIDTEADWRLAEMKYQLGRERMNG